MKVGRVFVGDGVTVGAGSTVLYDTFVSAITPASGRSPSS